VVVEAAVREERSVSGHDLNVQAYDLCADGMGDVIDLSREAIPVRIVAVRRRRHTASDLAVLARGFIPEETPAERCCRLCKERGGSMQHAPRGTGSSAGYVWHTPNGGGAGCRTCPRDPFYFEDR
jgi:hypothetical protein